MAYEKKRERFQKVAADRTRKINDLLRLLGNCANKNNYSYTDEEVRKLFSFIEENLQNAKNKYQTFFNEKMQREFCKDFEEHYTWIEGFMRNVRRMPNKAAVMDPKAERIWSYRALNEEVNRCANALKQIGIQKGESVLFKMSNSFFFICLYIACHKIGAIACPVYMKLSPGETAEIMDEIAPRIFLYEMNGDTELALTLVQKRPKHLIVTHFPQKLKAKDERITWEKFLHDASYQEPDNTYPFSMYQETVHFYTSGTTGRAKCIPVTSINEVLTAQDMMINFGVGSFDIVMNLSSWAHRGGLHCAGPSTMLYCGGTVIILGAFERRFWLEFIERYQITYVVGMPFILELLANAQQREHRNLHSVRGVISMGSPLSREEYLNLYQMLSHRIYNAYGTTETFCNAAFCSEDGLYESGYVGKSFIGDEVEIVTVQNGEKHKVPKDGVTRGEIVVRSLAKSSGYYDKSAEQTRQKYKNGFLYTGDIGTWDLDGNITVCGRNDDMIIRCGEKIYPIEIEEMLLECDGVKDCLITAVQDEKDGEAIVAYVVRNDEKLTVEKLNDFCQNERKMSQNKLPKYYRFKKVLPKTENGKKRYYKAKKMAESDLKNQKLLTV